MRGVAGGVSTSRCILQGRSRLMWAQGVVESPGWRALSCARRTACIFLRKSCRAPGASLTRTVACRSSSIPTRWLGGRVGSPAPRRPPAAPKPCWCWRCWAAPRWRAWPSVGALLARTLQVEALPRLSSLSLLGTPPSSRRHREPTSRPRRTLRQAGCTPRSSIWRS
jgi:hypothetical protein